MDIRIFETAQEASKAGAKLIADVIKSQSATVLGLATGSTPVGMYQEWARMNAAGELSFETVSSYNLDEYIGLDGTHDQSYRYFMNSHLFDHVNIDKSRTFVPNGLEPDSEKACREYDEVVAATGGVDLQLLGIGHNGHIGFNEPASEFCKNTQCVDLAESTIEANKRFFEKE